MSRSWRIALGLAISALALVIALRHVAFRDFARDVASAHLAWLWPALGCFACAFALRALRWAVLLDFTPYWTTLLSLGIGYMLNNVLPLRAGEVGRALVVSRKTGVRVAHALSSVVVERVLDLAAVVLLFVLLARLVPMPPTLARAATVAAIVLVASMSAGGVLLWRPSVAEKTLRSWLVAHLGVRGERWWQRLREAGEDLRAIGPRRLALVLALTAAIWAMTILIAAFAMGAFMAPNAMAAAVVVVSSNLGGALPSAPGGFGVIQTFAKEALVVPFHVDEARALAYVFVWSLGQQLLLVLVGLAALGRFGISLGQARGRDDGR